MWVFFGQVKTKRMEEKGKKEDKKRGGGGEEGDERRRMGEGERSRGKWRELLSPITMILRKE